MTWREPADPATGMGGGYGPEHVTERVRLEMSASRAAGGSMEAYSRYEGPSGTVFVDARNSEGGVPRVGALVSVDGGSEMQVRAVSPLRGLGGALHHTELEVG
jgi:hypothetical protein